ncbi:hypothetical protein AFLA_003856 [Aspergillus flavus NRRL3357]|nr:hypothetical protein AFLA_003856 [Aspergillus flavus NRRL3357]
MYSKTGLLWNIREEERVDNACYSTRLSIHSHIPILKSDLVAHHHKSWPGARSLLASRLVESCTYTYADGDAVRFVSWYGWCIDW